MKANGDAQRLYEVILQTANKFLRNAKMFEIHILKDHDPTYEELAKIMHTVGSLVYDLSSDEDPLMAQKAVEYVRIMTDMAIAIRNNDPNALSKLTAELDMKPFI